MTGNCIKDKIAKKIVTENALFAEKELKPEIYLLHTCFRTITPILGTIHFSFTSQALSFYYCNKLKNARLTSRSQKKPALASEDKQCTVIPFD